MDIANARILITGGAKRIGAALTRSLARRGARIIIHCNHSEDEAAALLREMGGASCGHQVLKCDLRQPEEINDFFCKAILQEAIDVLINNAAIYHDCRADEENPTQAAEQMQINFAAPVQLMKLFAEQKNLQCGCVINMLDQTVLRKDDNGGSYIRSKKMLYQATIHYAKLLAAQNIRVNAIAPGPVLPPPGYSGGGFQKILKHVPLQRPVKVEDISSTAEFIIANESLTGAIIAVDGGMHL